MSIWEQALDEVRKNQENAQQVFEVLGDKVPAEIRKRFVQNWQEAAGQLSQAIVSNLEKTPRDLETMTEALRAANAQVREAREGAVGPVELLKVLERATRTARQMHLVGGAGIEPIDPWPRKKG